VCAGDIQIHEMAWAEDELWFVNTRFSCLCTRSNLHCFQPRWRPPFVTALAPEDRCHLNGLGLHLDDCFHSVWLTGRDFHGKAATLQVSMQTICTHSVSAKSDKARAFSTQGFHTTVVSEFSLNRSFPDERALEPRLQGQQLRLPAVMMRGQSAADATPHAAKMAPT
jgi:hypothetical protein